MADDISRLILAVDSKQVTGARGELGRFVGTAGAAEGAAKGFGATMLKATLIIGGTVVALRTAQKVIGGITRVAMEFEESMAGVQAVTRATTDEMEAMESVARQLGATTRFSAAEAAEGMRFLGMAGFETNEIIAAMPGLLDLAAASGMQLGEAADITSNIMSGFALAAHESSRVADLLAGAASSANTNVQQLGEGMKFVAPIASALGIDIEETAAAMGVLSDAGLQGSMAGTGLRQVLSGLANATPKAKKALEAYGLTLEELNPATNSIVEIIDRLEDAGLNAADALTVFGDRGAPAVLALTSQAPRLRELNEDFRDMEGRAKEMAGVMGDTLSGDLRTLKSAMEELALSINEDTGLTASFRWATQAATDFIRAITADPTQNMGLTEMVAELERVQMGLANANEAGASGDPIFEKLTQRFHQLNAGFRNAVANMETQDLEGELSSLEDDISRYQRNIKSFQDAATVSTGADRKALLVDIEKEKQALRVAMATREQLSVFLIQKTEEDIAAREAAEAEAADKKARALEIQQRQEQVAREIASAETIAEVERMLMTEEELIRDSYQRQIDLVEANVTSMGERQRLVAELTAKMEEDIRGAGGGKGLVSEEDIAGARAIEQAFAGITRQAGEATSIMQGAAEGGNMLGSLFEVTGKGDALTDELSALEDQYAVKRQLILENEELTEKQRQELLLGLKSDYANQLRATGVIEAGEQVEAFGQFQSDLLTLAKSGSKEAMAVYKAFAITDAIISTYQAANKALATIPPPYSYVAAAVAVAAGMANVAAIKSQGAGNYAQGGIVPGASFSGDQLQANVNSREMILNVPQQKELFDVANGKRKGGGAGGNVTVINNGPALEVERVEQDDAGNMEIYVKAARQAIAGDLMSGDGAVNRGLDAALARKGVA